MKKQKTKRKKKNKGCQIYQDPYSSNKEIQESLINKIIKASNYIHNQQIRGSGQYIVCSAQVAEVLENLDIRKYRKKKLLQIFKSQENEKASE